MTGTEKSWASRRAEAARILAELKACPDTGRRAALRDAAVEAELPLVRYLARRFADRGIPLDDLVQVGCVGLIKAVDRFDPDRGIEFSSFATPTILGEIKRHFRDSGWLLRVPRRAQEIQTALERARGDLTQELSRPPTVRELAERLAVDEEVIVEALDVHRGYAGVPLEAVSDPDGGARNDLVATTDVELERVALRETLRPAFDQLPPLEQEILVLRFFRGQTQADIARVVGVSQMQVSRLITRALGRLRETIPSEVD